jgi:predicted alpha/beta hydrolase family esterase
VPTRAFIIHGYQSHPAEAWLPWLHRELAKHGCTVFLPAMPHPDHPVIHEWTAFITSLIGEPDSDTLIIAHSLGCQAVLRYLETVGAAGKSVRKTVLVAGTFPTERSTSDAYQAAGGDPVLLPWFSTGVNAQLVKRAAGACTIILSDKDPYIDIADATTRFRHALDPHIVIVPGAGHFNEDDGLTELPEALAALLSPPFSA